MYTLTHVHTHTCTHSHMHLRAMGMKKKIFEKYSFQVRFERADRGSMTNRNRELVPGNWSLVRETLLTTGLSEEGWCA